MNFVQFAQQNGVLIRDLYADGRIHRVPTAAHPRARNGAYKWTGEWGWIQAWETHAEPIVFRPESVPVEIVHRDMRAERERERVRHAKAAQQAAELVASCRHDNHPYLDAKGFPDERALVSFDGRMVVPMRDCRDYRRINSVQWISSDGEKKFMPGGAAKGSVFILGNGPESWLCEGYATGLSVRAALASMYRPGRVVVCFSASNLEAVAASLGGRRYVVADNDASGTGALYAGRTGLPWVMPPEAGMDANDWHQRDGIAPLAKAMRELARR